MSVRPSRIEIYSEIVGTVAKRATCNRRKVGALLVKNGRIIATGYNGAPSGMSHCLDEGCIILNGHCIRTLHAETSLISYCARNGIATDGSMLVVSTCPCYECAKLIINAGINKVLYLEPYLDNKGFDLLVQAGIEINLILSDDIPDD